MAKFKWNPIKDLSNAWEDAKKSISTWDDNIGSSEDAIKGILGGIVDVGVNVVTAGLVDYNTSDGTFQQGKNPIPQWWDEISGAADERRALSETEKEAKKEAERRQKDLDWERTKERANDVNASNSAEAMRMQAKAASRRGRGAGLFYQANPDKDFLGL